MAKSINDCFDQKLFTYLSPMVISPLLMSMQVFVKGRKRTGKSIRRATFLRR